MLASSSEKVDCVKAFLQVPLDPPGILKKDSLLKFNYLLGEHKVFAALYY